MYKCTMTPGDPSMTGAVNPETLKPYTHEAYDVSRACRSVTKAANTERAGSAGLSDVWKQKSLLKAKQEETHCVTRWKGEHSQAGQPWVLSLQPFLGTRPHGAPGFQEDGTC